MPANKQTNKTKKSGFEDSQKLKRQRDRHSKVRPSQTQTSAALPPKKVPLEKIRGNGRPEESCGLQLTGEKRSLVSKESCTVLSPTD